MEEDNLNKESNSKSFKIGIAIFAIILLIAIIMCVCVICCFSNGETTITGNQNNTLSNLEIKESEYRIANNSLQPFDLYFLKLENTKENKLYSPLSIKYALKMLEDGAEGEAKQQISNIIGEYKSNKYINSENISLANAIFVKDTVTDVKESYITTLQKNRIKE